MPCTRRAKRTRVMADVGLKPKENERGAEPRSESKCAASGR